LNSAIIYPANVFFPISSVFSHKLCYMWNF
jgi:hypothetical protein